jgi:enoyl-CoA hydratase
MTDRSAINENSEFLLERMDGGICSIALNRPDKLNAQSMTTMQMLHGLIEDISHDDGIRCLILTGAGRGFCAGLDLSGAPAGAGEFYRLQEVFAGTIQKLRRLDKPIIAAVNGAAVGAGFAIALAADIRIASKDARFHIGAVKIGLSAGECGISYHLPRMIGAARAFELMLTGRPIDAVEAARIGLISDVLECDDLMMGARKIANAIIGNSPYAVKHTKQIMWANLDAASLDAAIELENRTQTLAGVTEDFREAVAAFREKRKPHITGR